MQPKDGMPTSMQMLRHLGSSIMQGFPNLNSVEPPISSAKTKENSHIPDATNDNHQLAVFMKAQCSQVSIRYINQPTCQMPSACDYNTNIYASICYKQKLSQKQG